MKFTISKESFLDAINQVQHVVSSRTTLAILSNVLLKAKDGVLELTFRQEPGRGGNGRGCQVTEVWVIKK